jgi:hypothetical protein
VKPLHVGGIGLWTPGFASAAAWRAGTPDPAVATPRAELLPPALRRRATPLASMVAAAAAEAAAQAGADLSRLPLVFGSALGEQSALSMLEEYRHGEGMPSPTRFHNSVHNGPVAYVSIATGNRHFSTTLAAGWETPAAGLLEAAALLAQRGGEVLLVLGDQAPLPPFHFEDSFPPLAIAFHLADSPGAGTLGTLRGPRRAEGRAPRVPVSFAHHTLAGALALAAAVWDGAEGEVALGPAGPRGWAVDVVPRGAR